MRAGWWAGWRGRGRWAGGGKEWRAQRGALRGVLSVDVLADGDEVLARLQVAPPGGVVEVVHLRRRLLRRRRHRGGGGAGRLRAHCGGDRLCPCPDRNRRG